MFGRFHEKDYDGIVLKMPSWFIDMNELRPIIKELQVKLKGCKKSMYYQDHLNNLYELENEKEKKDIVKNEKEKTEESIRRSSERFENIVNGNIKIVEWRNVPYVLSGDNLYIGEEAFDYNQYFNPKGSVKTDVVRKIFSYCTDISKMKEFLYESFHMLKGGLRNHDEFTFKWKDTTFTASSYGADLQVNLKIAYIQTSVKKAKNGGYKYRLQQLQKDDTGYFTDLGNEKIYLNDYDLVRNEFHKKQKP